MQIDATEVPVGCAPTTAGAETKKDLNGVSWKGVGKNSYSLLGEDNERGCWKQAGVFNEIKLDLGYQTVSLLGFYPRKFQTNVHTKKDVCHFTSVLFVTPLNWKKKTKHDIGTVGDVGASWVHHMFTQRNVGSNSSQSPWSWMRESALNLGILLSVDVIFWGEIEAGWYVSVVGCAEMGYQVPSKLWEVMETLWSTLVCDHYVGMRTGQNPPNSTPASSWFWAMCTTPQ